MPVVGGRRHLGVTCQGSPGVLDNRIQPRIFRNDSRRASSRWYHIGRRIEAAAARSVQNVAWNRRLSTNSDTTVTTATEVSGRGPHGSPDQAALKTDAFPLDSALYTTQRSGAWSRIHPECGQVVKRGLVDSLASTVHGSEFQTSPPPVQQSDDAEQGQEKRRGLGDVDQVHVAEVDATCK